MRPCLLIALFSFCFATAWSRAEALRESNSPRGIPLPAGVISPQWPKPGEPIIGPNSPGVCSGDMEVLHSADTWGGFVIRISGRPFAIGQSRPLVGYLNEGLVRWFNPNEAADRKISVNKAGKGLIVHLECRDPEGTQWRISQQFAPSHILGAIDIDTEVRVDHDRDVAFFPMLVVFPGAGTFGERKHQGLMAGLEYLEDEPSSSEADLSGPAAKRQVPDTLKLTFPLMAIQANDRYLGLSWQMRPHYAAVFDSPDRLFGSGGHTMGLLFPGSTGNNRDESNLIPKLAERLIPGSALLLRAALLGGRGDSVIEAVRHYVALRPLPPLPEGGIGLHQYVPQAAGAWLHSGIRESNLVHHAILGGSFPLQPAADAAVWTRWLAEKVQDQDLAIRLGDAASNFLALVPPGSFARSAVGHIRYPVAPLLFGHVEESITQSKHLAADSLRGFQPDGSVRYHVRPGIPDYSKTHYSNEANGLTSRAVLDMLETASFCGDDHLIQESIGKLRAMARFHKGVPRGAQTWECPLHTPDVLASAQMVRAYLFGYELTGDVDFLSEAQYWAWTGVPFVYLVNPTDKPVGLYSTIAVFGATQWQAPVWLGLPVQWCGLVYADALYGLAFYDPKGPWRKLADGITLSGIQQCWPATAKDTQGLLPDSFVLRAQQRNGPAINPATVQACAAQLFRQTPVYDFRCLRQSGLLVHAPGAIGGMVDKKRHAKFEITPAFSGHYFVLLNGTGPNPKLKINGTNLGSVHVNAEHGNSILKLRGKALIDVSWDAKDN